MRRAAVVLALVIGARAEAQRQPGWEVRVPERVEITPGSTGTLAISLAVDRGLTVSKDAPVIVDITPPKGIVVKKRRLGRGEAVDPEADAPRFAINVRGDEPGDHAVRLRVRFWLCGGKTCRPVDVRRATTIAVAAPVPPAEPGVDAGVAVPPDARGR